MNANEFLSKLEDALRGEVPASVLESNLRYYRGYIAEERGKGREEQEILDGLGDPRLIARTIIETQSADGSREDYRESYQEADSGERYCEERRHVHTESWKISLIVILVLVVIILIVGSIFGLAVRILLSPVFWIALAIVFVLRFLSDRRR